MRCVAAAQKFCQRDIVYLRPTAALHAHQRRMLPILIVHDAGMRCKNIAVDTKFSLRQAVLSETRIVARTQIILISTCNVRFFPSCPARGQRAVGGDSTLLQATRSASKF